MTEISSTIEAPGTTVETDGGSATSTNVLSLGDVVLQCGLTLPDARIAYKTYGELNAGVVLTEQHAAAVRRSLVP